MGLAVHFVMKRDKNVLLGGATPVTQTTSMDVLLRAHGPRHRGDAGW